MHAYAKFGWMIVTSTVVMLGLMYLNTFQLSHVYFSETRTFMAIIMGSAMALVMLAFMLGMYKDRARNVWIVAGSVAAFVISLWLVRSQATIDDTAYMRAMIPHHSIAVLTSKRAHLTDPRVRKLADGIIAAQLREIDEMKALIADIERDRQ